MASLEHKLEAILFYKGEPESKAKLAELLEVTPEEVAIAANALLATLNTRGVRLLMIGDEYELVTAPETSDIIARTRKEELTRDLGKAGSETLAVVLYRGPVNRADIEYIRGVNCSFVLRNLLIRGLVERIPNPSNSRSWLYRATPEALKHLGITNVSELPEYAATSKRLQELEARRLDPDAIVSDKDM